MRALVLATLLLAGCGSVDVEQGTRQVIAAQPEAGRPAIAVHPAPPPLPITSVTLQWEPVTEDVDGNPIPLEGYRLMWGQAPDQLYQSIALDPSTLIYVIDDLTPGVWYFEIQAYDYVNQWVCDPAGVDVPCTAGATSAPSNMVSITIG